MKEKLIFDFRNLGKADLWRPVNDVIMGGDSEGQLEKTGQGDALFTGRISLENLGGFASVRSMPGDYDLSGYDGIAIRLKGDGKHYKLSLRTDAHFDGVVYQARFTTEDAAWTTLHIPFTDFIPTFRGVGLSGVDPLDPAKVRIFGLLISDGQEGPFRVELQWIKAYRLD